MLSKSTAILHTTDRNWLMHMHQLLSQAGFRDTQVFPATAGRLSPYRKGPLPFVFLHGAMPIERSAKAIQTIRGHQEMNVRFLPVILVTDSGDSRTLMSYVQMGCDDIMLSPPNAGHLIQRLRLQIDRPREYFQTLSYFGPDRRQHELTAKQTHHGRGKGDHFFRRFCIQRDPKRGVSILSTETHLPERQETRMSA